MEDLTFASVGGKAWRLATPAVVVVGVLNPAKTLNDEE
jgi:hypothetical protein